MRILRTLLVAFLPVFMSATNWAQQDRPKPLVDQIRSLEIAVERPPAKDDGATWLKLAILRQDAAEYRDSERAYRRALALLRHGNPAFLADALDQMGTMYVERGEFSKAEQLERKALAIREERGDSLGIGVSHMHLAVLSLGRRDLASAEVDAEIGVNLLVPERTSSAAQSVATPEQKMTALIDLSLTRCARGACASAIPDLQRALQIAHANYSKDSIPVGFLDFLLGYASWQSAGNESGGELMKNGIQELETQIGWGHPTYLSALRQYKSFLMRNGHTTEATAIEAKLSHLERSSDARHVQPQDAYIQLSQP
jgi:tetratricopeptide (TPR) repeat protein